MSPITGKIRRAIWIDAGAVGACVMTAVVAYFLGIAPLLEERRVAEVEQRELSERQSRAAEILGSINEMDAELNDLRQRLTDSNMKLSPVAMVNIRVAELTSLLTDCSLSVDDINIEDAVKGLHCETVPIQISGRGGYVHCAQFLHSLSERLPDIHVACLNLKRSPAGQQEEHTFEFDLVWYTSSS